MGNADEPSGIETGPQIDFTLLASAVGGDAKTSSQAAHRPISVLFTEVPTGPLRESCAQAAEAYGGTNDRSSTSKEVAAS